MLTLSHLPVPEQSGNSNGALPFGANKKCRVRSGRRGQHCKISYKLLEKRAIIAIITEC